MFSSNASKPGEIQDVYKRQGQERSRCHRTDAVSYTHLDVYKRQDVKTRQDQKLGDILRQVQPADLLKFGLIPEFVGRVPVIATLDDLDEEALVRVLTEPKNALTKQYQRMFCLLYTSRCV